MSAPVMHPIFMKRTFTAKEIADGTERAITQFKKAYPEFYPCEANAEMLIDFILSQLGSNEEPAGAPEYPYPYLFENFQFAYHSILDSGRWFVARPETAEEIQAREGDEAFERQKQITEQNYVQRQQDEHTAVIQETIQVSKDMSLKALRVTVANERPSSPNGRKHQSVAMPGDESRSHNSPRLEVAVRVSAKALYAARQQVALDNPHLNRDSVSFNNLVHEYIQKSSNA
jgi:hypothetical protein